MHDANHRPRGPMTSLWTAPGLQTAFQGANSSVSSVRGLVKVVMYLWNVL